MLSLPHVQIIIDVFVIITILILIRRLDKKMEAHFSSVDASLLSEFNKMLAESQKSSNCFLEAVEENRKVLGKLFLQLDNKEKKLTALVEEAEVLIKKLDEINAAPVPAASPENRYDDVLRMVQRGISREEISRHSGFTEDEISLIEDLAKTRTDLLT
jgi:CRISPR/Cas system CMR subunit Cmr4 (Cas7 group RAMP superfamily)